MFANVNTNAPFRSQSGGLSGGFSGGFGQSAAAQSDAKKPQGGIQATTAGTTETPTIKAMPPRNPFAVNPPAKSATVAGDSTSSSTIAQTLQIQTDKPAAMQQEKPKTMYGLGIGTASAQIQSANEQEKPKSIQGLGSSSTQAGYGAFFGSSTSNTAAASFEKANPLRQSEFGSSPSSPFSPTQKGPGSGFGSNGGFFGGPVTTPSETSFGKPGSGFATKTVPAGFVKTGRLQSEEGEVSVVKFAVNGQTDREKHAFEFWNERPMGRSSTRGRGTGRRESGGGRREMREMGGEFGAVANAFGGMSMDDSTATFGWGDTSAGTGFDGFNYGECRYCGAKQSDHLPTDCPKKNNVDIQCFRCLGTGHVSRECTKEIGVVQGQSEFDRRGAGNAPMEFGRPPLALRMHNRRNQENPNFVGPTDFGSGSSGFLDPSLTQSVHNQTRSPYATIGRFGNSSSTVSTQQQQQTDESKKCGVRNLFNRAIWDATAERNADDNSHTNGKDHFQKTNELESNLPATGCRLGQSPLTSTHTQMQSNDVHAMMTNFAMAGTNSLEQKMEAKQMQNEGVQVGMQQMMNGFGQQQNEQGQYNAFFQIKNGSIPNKPMNNMDQTASLPHPQSQSISDYKTTLVNRPTVSQFAAETAQPQAQAVNQAQQQMPPTITIQQSRGTANTRESADSPLSISYYGDGTQQWMTIVLKPLASAGPLHISTQGFPLTTATSSELPSQSAHIHIRQTSSTPLASSPPSSSVPQSPNHSISSHRE
ncbi:hypothetical protein WR25_23997 [Diploscapter pachys]|uniref:CCHC-type domain-containing protein n=1 Tax=Diploscapter pachys TaxID=2018661 RepID=A0A2A2L0C4_9BILA|nr:hypothetical protein WR25_23997 [Diploscapter pachys]